jgi:hypothetical protein
MDAVLEKGRRCCGRTGRRGTAEAARDAVRSSDGANLDAIVAVRSFVGAQRGGFAERAVVLEGEVQ